ncbi:unnamed protein product [Mytilus edulis]|uniref:DZIP3-like HEPN domain-containing protein n=1 Tax=Mytilus edulis TaxID=6550 RepID=A0A8S3URF5_MYTED|nr:unnamed protein product [Mytilus edulis]
MESKSKKDEGDDDLISISLEEENHARLYLLLFGISEQAVRALFDREFDPSCLHDTLKKESYKLNDLKNKRIINKSQWRLLFPVKGEPQSSKFDVTLMNALLTNLANLSPYDKLPLLIDTSISADLARIRYYRNYISHESLKEGETINVTEAWDDISGAVRRLGGKQMHDVCTDLKTKSLDRSTVPWNIRVQINSKLSEWRINDTREGHIEVVLELLQNKADVNKCSDKGASPLMVACWHNNIEIVKLLLEHTADINMRDDNGMSPLFIACQNNHIETVKTLLDNKADIDICNLNGISPLGVACQLNRIEIVNMLLQNRADINKFTDTGLSPLMVACFQNNIEMLKILLEKNANINMRAKNGVSPLFLACQKIILE